jgi:hypothetical protein
MAKNKQMFWTYSGHKPKRDYIDPRIAIAKQVGWQKFSGEETSYCIPEPDNYNRAVITEHPVECSFVEDQVIYKDVTKNFWFTVLLLPEEQQGEYDAWIDRIKPQAFWQHRNAPKVKKTRSIPL